MPWEPRSRRGIRHTHSARADPAADASTRDASSTSPNAACLDGEEPRLNGPSRASPATARRRSRDRPAGGMELRRLYPEGWSFGALRPASLDPDSAQPGGRAQMTPPGRPRVSPPAAALAPPPEYRAEPAALAVVRAATRRWPPSRRRGRRGEHRRSSRRRDGGPPHGPNLEERVLSEPAACGWAPPAKPAATRSRDTSGGRPDSPELELAPQRSAANRAGSLPRRYLIVLRTSPVTSQ